MDTSLNTSLRGKKILIVDDELGILEVLEFMLSDAGFAVTTALNGQDVRSHVLKRILLTWLFLII